MELINLLSKQLTVADLFQYMEDLTEELYHLKEEEGAERKLEDINKKAQTAAAFLADYLFDGNRDIVDDITEAETEARAKVGRDGTIPFD